MRHEDARQGQAEGLIAVQWCGRSRHSWERPTSRSKEWFHDQEVPVFSISVFSELDFDLVRNRAHRVLTTPRPRYAGHEQTHAKGKGEGEGKTTKLIKQDENRNSKKDTADEKAQPEQDVRDADAHECSFVESASIARKNEHEYADALGRPERVTPYPHTGDADAGNYACSSDWVSREDGHEYAHALGQPERVTPYPHARDADAG
jgi:hypothetical protein